MRSTKAIEEPLSKPITVLVVDDSALVRNLLVEGLSADPEIEIVGSAGDADEARDLIMRTHPDVVTLDVEMPQMDGLEFLRRIMPRFPIRAVMVSALTGRGQEVIFNALEAGAVDFVIKPSGGPEALTAAMPMLRAKVKTAAAANVSHWKERLAERSGGVSRATRNASSSNIIVLGASTGGTEAVKVVLQGLPTDGPGVVVVQHMPDEFTRYYAERLDELFPFKCNEARDGQLVRPGSVLVAPGGLQSRIFRTSRGYVMQVGGTERRNGHAPSVDTMLHSVAEQAGPNAAAAVLTGMGRDGAAGLLAARHAGVRTFVQDESSSTVFGMPRAALEEGAVDETTPLAEIPGCLVRWMRETRLAS